MYKYKFVIGILKKLIGPVSVYHLYSYKFTLSMDSFLLIDLRFNFFTQIFIKMNSKKYKNIYN